MVFNSVLQVEKPLHYVLGLYLCVSGCVCRQRVLQTNLDSGSVDPLVLIMLTYTAGSVVFLTVK